MTKHEDTPFANWLQAENGRAAALCRKSKIINPVVLSKYKRGDLAMGLRHAIEVERLTMGRFRAEDLAPKRDAELIAYLRSTGAEK
jgi:hypothetical protein